LFNKCSKSRIKAEKYSDELTFMYIWKLFNEMWTIMNSATKVEICVCVCVCVWRSCICCITIIVGTLNGHYGFRWIGSKRTINSHNPQNINKCSQPHAHRKQAASFVPYTFQPQKGCYTIEYFTTTAKIKQQQGEGKNKKQNNHITEKRLPRCSYKPANLCEILQSVCIETWN